MKNLIRQARYALSALALGATAVGCQSTQKPQSRGIPTDPAVTDVSALPPASPAMTPIMPSAPVYTQQPVTPVAMASNQTPEYGSTVGGGSYTVQKGDTLFKIAREHYGEASAWRKIAAANPGAGNVIKPGQKLILP